MAFVINTGKVAQTFKSQAKPKKLPYEIPERYQNAFYLANSSLFDHVNWFLHRAYEIAFPKLKRQLEGFKPDYTFDQQQEKLENIVSTFDQCNCITDIRFPFKKVDGKFETIRGFRGQHGLATGYLPSLGGIRLNGNLTRDQIKGLAVLNTYRNASLGLNLSGSFGGIKIDPKLYSEDELQAIVKSYTEEVAKRGFLGIGDLCFPDMNCSSKEMHWIAEACSKKSGNHFISALGTKEGLEGSEYIGSQAAHFIIEQFLENEQILDQLKISKGIKDKTFIIQGLGKMGAALSESLVKEGAKCVGIKELDGYVYDENGLDINEVLNCHRTGTLKSLKDFKPEQKDDIYLEKCDMLIFAANQKSLICYVADNVKAKVIIEAADGALSPNSTRVLMGKQRLVVPDLLTCSGVTIASYIEYIHNLQESRKFQDDHLKFADDIYKDIAAKIRDSQKLKCAAFGEVVTDSGSYVNSHVTTVLNHTLKNVLSIVDEFGLGLDIRSAVYILAIRNIFKTLYTTQHMF